MKNKKLPLVLLLLALVFALSFGTLPAVAVTEDILNIKALSCVLMDGKTGEVLYQQSPDLRCYPASVTKIMTLVLALEAVAQGRVNVEDMVTTSAEAAAMGGSQVYLFEGETRSLREMLVAVAVGSGNDASVAVAEFIGGSLNGFMELMNKRAGELGMTNTCFTNPHGLHDEGHYTTAGDLAKLAYHALSVPLFLEYTSIYEYQFRPDPKPLVLWNSNRLLKWFDGVDGMKTGFTQESGYNLVATAERDGLRLISVYLGGEDSNTRFTESMKLLNYGFSQYEYVNLYKAGDVLGEVKVNKGAQDSVTLVAGKDVGVLQKKGEQSELTARLVHRPYLNAPVKKGDAVGEIVVLKNGLELERAPLLAGEDVAKGTWMRQIKKLITGITF
ncbi:MAG: D-alanyl-D-alanine carboxypeptidase [Clostridiales bacterium]|nr:D-alanyl-D-alanine carboxypeptidase [Clostridiales bacterium]